MEDLVPPLSYAPDGLYESDVDALIAEYCPIDEPHAVTEHRHVRRLTRQTINAALRSRAVGPNRADHAAA